MIALHKYTRDRTSTATSSPSWLQLLAPQSPIGCHPSQQLAATPVTEMATPQLPIDCPQSSIGCPPVTKQLPSGHWCLLEASTCADIVRQ